MRQELELEPAPLARDPQCERREQDRYRVLRAVYARTGADCTLTISGLEVGEELGLSREEVFRAVQFLAQRELLHYVGAGPRVCITPAGVEHLRRRAGRRRSVRDME